MNQSIEAFESWLSSQKPTETAIAGDPCHCWLAQWFEAQGIYVYGVYPEHYLERCSDAPGGASQEVLLAEPEKTEDGEWVINKADRIPLEQWAIAFESEIDRRYCQPFVVAHVSRDLALQVLQEVKAFENLIRELEAIDSPNRA